MLIFRIWNYLKGYVIIIAKGFFLEKFLNMCANRQIPVWNIRRREKSSMNMNVSIEGFKKIRPIAKQTASTVRIEKKVGLPFLIGKYKKRKAFTVGIIFFIISINLMSSCIWDIEISGNERVETGLIKDILIKQGIKAGTIKYRVDTDKLVEQIMLEIDDLAWVGVELRGTRLKVKVAETVKPPELISLDTPCNIVASKDGIIENVVVKNGQEQVLPGDTVVKGQILVSGIIESSVDKTEQKLVHAIAEIKARTWYEGSFNVSQKITEQIKTGLEKKRYSLELFSTKIKIPMKKVGFEQYELISEKKNIKLGEDFILPIALITDTYVEIIEREKELDIREAKQLAADNAYNKVLKIIPENSVIKETSLEYVQDDKGELKAHVLIECLESIGVKQKIGGY